MEYLFAYYGFSFYFIRLWAFVIGFKKSEMEWHGYCTICCFFQRYFWSSYAEANVLDFLWIQKKFR